VQKPSRASEKEFGGSVCHAQIMISKTAARDTFQIKISVIGRKSGRTISIPVWFVLEAEKLYLLRCRARRRTRSVSEYSTVNN
jgi:hypothetical protein